VGIQGDIAATVSLLSKSLNDWSFLSTSPWWGELREVCARNTESSMLQIRDTHQPLNYYAAFSKIAPLISPNTYVVSEGANTMDIGRVMLPNELPRHRLDAGTFGTMGVGPAFAIAAALYCSAYDPGARVVCVEGDSAFGFSGMELETMARYKLPILLVIFNNNGIYSGFESELYKEITSEGDTGLCSPPTALLPMVRYDRMAGMLGLDGVIATSLSEIETAVTSGLARTTPSIVNIVISPTAGRKAQQHEWLTRAKL